MMVKIIAVVLAVLMVACNTGKESSPKADTPSTSTVLTDPPAAEQQDSARLLVSRVEINTGKVQPSEIVAYAKTLIGTPYRYGSTNPAVGFDCSGFITYVFNHFNIAVPRSSIDFTSVGRTVALDSAAAGDLVLFTGTDSTERHIGHMGIITLNNGGAIEFIHSTSGKQYGVTITPLNRYYMGRFMRVSRIFSQNEKSNR